MKMSFITDEKDNVDSVTFKGMTPEEYTLLTDFLKALKAAKGRFEFVIDLESTDYALIKSASNPG